MGMLEGWIGTLNTPEWIRSTSNALHVSVQGMPADDELINALRVADAGDQYETVAASQTNQALGATGALGDYLKGLILVVATAATAATTIKDGSDTAISIFPNSPGGGVGTYYVPVGLKSRTGAWQITTGAGVSVIALGSFS